MRPVLGRLILFVATALAVTMAVAPTAATATPSSAADHGDARSAASAFAAPRVPPCEDRAFNLLRGHWTQPVDWKFNAESTPAGLNADKVEEILTRSFDNITGARNNCGRADKVDARNNYEGRTTRSADISRLALCMRRDGRNVISFGPLPRGILAVTCTRHVDNRIVEADIRINSRYDWALSTANCSDQELLEPTVTHEVGHVYGLAHVSERRHPLLTMSTRSDGPCSNAASTLGLGDMLGLEQKY